MPQMNKGGKFVFGLSLIQAAALCSFLRRPLPNTASPQRAACTFSPAAR